jgi:ATP-dependent RNA helicase RhlE
MSFKNLKLNDDILSAIEDAGYETPTPIQMKAIPAILTGKDLRAIAQTGTGKTAAFSLPILELITKESNVPPKHVRVLILAPTRELAAQIKLNIDSYSKNMKITCAVVYGGVKIKNQIERLKPGLDILIATPGRLLDLKKQRAVNLSHVKCLVLDEADRMLDMGFLPDVTKISKFIPKDRQTLLFSATFSDDMRKMAYQFLTDPTTIEVAARNATADNVKQEFYLVDKTQKCELFTHLFKKENWYQALVFTGTKHMAETVYRKIRKSGFSTTVIHGDKPQAQRSQALSQFKANKIEILVATDIAARGLDIKELPHVINYDLPRQSEDYVHRIGRTGRAGEEGHSVSFIGMEDGKALRSLEKYLKSKVKLITEAQFEPPFNENDLPKTAPPPTVYKKNEDKRPQRNQKGRHPTSQKQPRKK